MAVHCVSRAVTLTPSRVIAFQCRATICFLQPFCARACGDGHSTSSTQVPCGYIFAGRFLRASREGAPHMLCIGAYLSTLRLASLCLCCRSMTSLSATDWESKFTHEFLTYSVSASPLAEPQVEIPRLGVRCSGRLERSRGPQARLGIQLEIIQRSILFLEAPEGGKRRRGRGGGMSQCCPSSRAVTKGLEFGPGIGKGIFNVTGVAGRKSFSVFQLTYVFPDVI